MKRKIFGKGINDASYKVTFYKPDGRRGTCPFYERWTDMLRRCYCPKQLERMPNYFKTEVCEEWLTFTNFKNWMEEQVWENKVLDKDLLGDGELYSPATCIFVPEYVNFAVMGIDKYKGVTLHKRDNVYQATICCFGKHIYLGSYSSEEEATEVYKLAKIEYLRKVINRYTIENGDTRVINVLEVKIADMVRRLT